MARYLSQLDTADRQEPSDVLVLKTTRLKEKFNKLKEEMGKLEQAMHHLDASQYRARSSALARCLCR